MHQPLCNMSIPASHFMCRALQTVSRQVTQSTRTLNTLNVLNCMHQTKYFKRYNHLSSTGTSMKLSECLQKVQTLFDQSKVPESAASAEYIIAFALGHKTLHGLSRDISIDANELKMIDKLVLQRQRRLPMQYVIGEWDFRDLNIICRPPVFIPRPETEELVGLALDDPVVQSANTFLEVGSGTGAICVSLLKELPQLQATVIEMSNEACRLTRENAQHMGVLERLHVINTVFDLGVLKLVDSIEEKSFDFLISNPPYVPTAAMDELAPEISLHEDLCALHGGDDGLKVVKYIHQMAAHLVKDRGSVWLEVDSSHPPMIKEMTSKHPLNRLFFVESYPDFNSKPRFCHLRVNDQ